jgi:hypothetical protein
MNKELTDAQLIECFGLVFESTHSDGFKRSEIKDLIFDKDYWFLEKPKDGWLTNLNHYLRTISFDMSLTSFNKFNME